MKTAGELKAEALAAIQALRALAVHGDEKEATVATQALLEITTKGIGQVESLAMHPDDRHAPAALMQSAASSPSWPVLVPVIEEQRENAIRAQLPTSFGEGESIRTTANKRGARRKFHPHSRTGFTWSVVCDLLADGEFPADADADDLLIACLQKIEENCQGDWERFPWPPKLIEDAEAENHRNDPLQFMVRRWLKDGLKSLIK